jgi:hypothetical protein
MRDVCLGKALGTYSALSNRAYQCGGLHQAHSIVHAVLLESWPVESSICDSFERTFHPGAQRWTHSASESHQVAKECLKPTIASNNESSAPEDPRYT